MCSQTALQSYEGGAPTFASDTVGPCEAACDDEELRCGGAVSIVHTGGAACACAFGPGLAPGGHCGGGGTSSMGRRGAGGGAAVAAFFHLAAATPLVGSFGVGAGVGALIALRGTNEIAQQATLPFSRLVRSGNNGWIVLMYLTSTDPSNSQTLTQLSRIINCLVSMSAAITSLAHSSRLNRGRKHVRESRRP